MKMFKQGEYVHIPSEVMLFFFEEEDREGQFYGWGENFKKTVVLQEPKKLMFVSSPHPEFCEVFYEGNLWTVQSRHVYKTGDSIEY